MSETSSAKDVMTVALAEAAEAMSERLSAATWVDLSSLSRQALNEAKDTAFIDEHRLHRFAAHLLVEAEIARRTEQQMIEYEARIEAMTPEERAAHQAEMDDGCHVVSLSGDSPLARLSRAQAATGRSS